MAPIANYGFDSVMSENERPWIIGAVAAISCVVAWLAAAFFIVNCACCGKKKDEKTQNENQTRKTAYYDMTIENGQEPRSGYRSNLPTGETYRTQGGTTAKGTPEYDGVTDRHETAARPKTQGAGLSAPPPVSYRSTAGGGYNVVNYKALMAENKRVQQVGIPGKTSPVDHGIGEIPAFSIVPRTDSKCDTIVDLKKFPTLRPTVLVASPPSNRPVQAEKAPKPVSVAKPRPPSPSLHKKPIQKSPTARVDKHASVGPPLYTTPPRSHASAQAAVGPPILPSSFFDRAIVYANHTEKAPAGGHDRPKPPTAPKFVDRHPLLDSPTAREKTVRPAEPRRRSPEAGHGSRYPAHTDARDGHKRHAATGHHGGSDGGGHGEKHQHHASGDRHGKRALSPAAPAPIQPQKGKKAGPPERSYIYGLKR